MVSSHPVDESVTHPEGFRQNAFAQASAIATVVLFLTAMLIVPYVYIQLRDEK